jgi:hypothetical protein
LSLNEKHRRFGVNGGGFNFVELLHGRQRQIAEKMLLANRTGQAIVEDV